MKKFLMFGAIICASVGSYASHIVVNSHISSNTTWTAANTYSLDGLIVVDSGVTLTIAPGTKICSGSGSGLVIQSTAQLIATGTADSMIVFTSDKALGLKSPGDWMGILWLGDAVNNDGVGITKTFGGESFVSNGSNDSYNGGSMRYTLIEYAGQKVIGDGISGALITQSLGTGTSLDHIQITNSVSNGMVINGGIYSASDFYFQNNYERGLYIAEGNRSTLTEVLVVKSPATLPTLPLNTIGIEIVNNNNPLVTPLSHPIIDGYTCIGPKHCGSRTGDVSIGMLFDRNGGGEFKNGVVSGFDVGLQIEDVLSSARTGPTSVSLKFEYSAIVENAVDLLYNTSPWNGCGVDINSWFINSCGNNLNVVGNLILDYDVSICNNYCTETPTFVIGSSSIIPLRDDETNRIGVLQEAAVFEWVGTCPTIVCGTEEPHGLRKPLSIYPNPSKAILGVALPSNVEPNTKLQLIHVNSGKVYNIAIAPQEQGHLQIDLQSYPSGIYKVLLVNSHTIYENTLHVLGE